MLTFYGCQPSQKDVRSNAVPLQVPIGAEEHFSGVVDLITNKAIIWDEESRGMTYKEIPIPEDIKETVQEYRQQLIENIAEYDDDLLVKFLMIRNPSLKKK